MPVDAHVTRATPRLVLFMELMSFLSVMGWIACPFVSCLHLRLRLTHCDRDKDQKGKCRTRRQDDRKGSRRLKRQNACERRADGCAAHLQKTQQRGCQAGLPSKRMERDRSAERIDQSHA